MKVLLFLLLLVLGVGGCAEELVVTGLDGVHLDPNTHRTVGVVAPAVEYGEPPANAVVLFDGSDISEWILSGPAGSAFPWKVENGYLEVVHEKDYLYVQTRRVFGDCQLHIEWATPEKVEGEGQMRGNSGVFLMGRYEVQMLDSFENETYPDGQAGAVYGQYPPLFNASRRPGEWQAYDIVFRRPRFDEQGNVVFRGRMTVLHNGVAVQNNVDLLGTTGPREDIGYQAHPDKMPVILQDHGNPMRFRNIWIVELPEQRVH